MARDGRATPTPPVATATAPCSTARDTWSPRSRPWARGDAAGCGDARRGQTSRGIGPSVAAAVGPPHQTAQVARQPCHWVTVCMPIHPLHGRRLRVVRIERDRHGRQFVTVEHPTAFWLRLPAHWTDRAAPPPPPRVDGRELRLSVAALVRLAAAVDVALGEKLDDPGSAPILAARSDTDRDAAAAVSGTSRAVSDGAAKRRRRAGDAGAQGPVRGKRVRRGER